MVPGPGELRGLVRVVMHPVIGVGPSPVPAPLVAQGQASGNLESNKMTARQCSRQGPGAGSEEELGKGTGCEGEQRSDTSPAREDRGAEVRDRWRT